MLRSFRFAGVLASTAALLLTAAAAAPAATVTPRSVTTLPLPAVADLEVAGRFVFVSGGRDSTDLLVLNAAGSPVRRIRGLAGPTGLLASPDGRMLYVAQTDAGGDSVVGVNTSTLKVTKRWPTGDGTCPSTLGRSGNYLYFGQACGFGGWARRLGRIDLRNGAVNRDVLGEDLYTAPLLEGGQRRLLVGEPGGSPAALRSFAVTATGALTPISENRSSQLAGSNLRDIDLTADGRTAWSAAGAPYRVQRWNTRDLSFVAGDEVTGPYPLAVELAPDGRTVAAGADATFDPDVFVFRPDGSSASVDIGGKLHEAGLAWWPDGKRLFALDWDRFTQEPSPPRLHVLTVG